MDAGPLLGALAILTLVAANGFFVAAEFRLVKVRQTSIDELLAEGKNNAKVVQEELRHLDTYIGSSPH